MVLVLHALDHGWVALYKIYSGADQKGIVQDRIEVTAKSLGLSGPASEWAGIIGDGFGPVGVSGAITAIRRLKNTPIIRKIFSLVGEVDDTATTASKAVNQAADVAKDKALKTAENAPKTVLNSLDDVAVDMRSNLPPGMNPKQFGEVLKWGGGSESARQRIATLTVDELRKAGITSQMADNWAAAYDAVARLKPNNPSAAGRADLMRQAARLLRDE